MKPILSSLRADYTLVFPTDKNIESALHDALHDYEKQTALLDDIENKIEAAMNKSGSGDVVEWCRYGDLTATVEVEKLSDFGLVSDVIEKETRANWRKIKKHFKTK